MSDRSLLSRRTVLRTLGLLGVGAIASPADARSDRALAADRGSVAADPGEPIDSSVYVGVVDRIVDGRHVVVLLEDCGTVVDRLVVPRRRFEVIAERDVLLVIASGDELLASRRLPRKPERPETDGDCTASRALSRPSLLSDGRPGRN